MRWDYHNDNLSLFHEKELLRKEAEDWAIFQLRGLRKNSMELSQHYSSRGGGHERNKNLHTHPQIFKFSGAPLLNIGLSKAVVLSLIHGQKDNSFLSEGFG